MIETAEILTPKMLESNGFELDEFKEWWVYKEKEQRNVEIAIAFRKDKKWVYDLSLYCENGTADLHLDSVYELQNILRTVRLFDLADKFNNMEDNTCKQA